TSREIVQMAREAGARKVYFASAAPPVRFPNVYGIDMPTRQELLANGRSDDEIAREIGADKLIYQDLDALVHAAQQVNPKITQFETSCFSGEYVTGDISPEYLAHIEAQRRDGARRQKEEAASSNQLDLNLLTVD
ncbi:MAG TPA: amidophosphoribosyltransferase, partial [Burkholderiales bacterium]|nr:amidophosphoribosyltransferase [Burkholderiales bacterium]